MKKITLAKSLIGAKPNQKATAASLGLKKIGQTVEKPDNEAIRGMIKTAVNYVSVEEV